MLYYERALTFRDFAAGRNVVHGVWLECGAYCLFALLRDPARTSPGQPATPAPTVPREHTAEEQGRRGQKAASAGGCAHGEAGCGTSSSRSTLSAASQPPGSPRGDPGLEGACGHSMGRGGESALQSASGGSWHYGLEWEVLVSALRHLTIDLHACAPLTA
jgi:hypothetical protein